MASLASHRSPLTLAVEPLRGLPLLACGLVVWLAGAAYCHGYERLLSEGLRGSWGGSLLWSAVGVVPWFALFEWSKQPNAAHAVGRPSLLLSLVIGIAALSVALEYAVNFAAGDPTDPMALLIMRRLPAIGVAILLIALVRKSALQQRVEPGDLALPDIAEAIDWIEAADNYVEIHSRGRVSLRRMTMRDAERALAGHGFVRIHRRFLVNRNRIAAVAGKNGHRTVRLRQGPELPIGRAFSPNLRETVRHLTTN